MAAQSLIGDVIVVFKERGHRVTMAISDDKTRVHRVANETEVLEGVQVPRSIELTTTGGAEPDMHVRVEVRDGSPTLTELSWKSGPGQSEIRQKHLRKTDVANLVTDLVATFIRVGQEAPESPRRGAPDIEALRERRRKVKEAHEVAQRFVERQRLPRERRVMTPEFLQKVADVYQANIDRAPTKAVREMFNVEERQASKYVQNARQRGLLPPTVRGQKKAWA